MAGRIENYRRQFSSRLRQLRLRAGFKLQAQFARELGVDPSTYQKYESGTAMPLHLVPQVCELLDVGPWLLLTGDSDQFAPPFQNKPQHLHCLKACTLVRAANV